MRTSPAVGPERLHCLRGLPGECLHPGIVASGQRVARHHPRAARCKHLLQPEKVFQIGGGDSASGHPARVRVGRRERPERLGAAHGHRGEELEPRQPEGEGGLHLGGGGDAGKDGKTGCMRVLHNGRVGAGCHEKAGAGYGGPSGLRNGEDGSGADEHAWDVGGD
eukprot:scaffold12020_cov122-Isochrysis_galbana.AAC.5